MSASATQGGHKK